MITFNKYEVFKILQEIAKQTYPELKILPFQIEIESKESKSIHGKWQFKKKGNFYEFKIFIYNLSRKTQYIISTTIHELAHHIDYCIRKKSGHDKTFYLVLKKLLEKAHELKYINLDEAKTKIDSVDLNQIEKIFWFSYIKRDLEN